MFSDRRERSLPARATLADPRRQENGKAEALARSRRAGDLPQHRGMATAAERIDEAERALRRVFGFDSFRGVQRAGRRARAGGALDAGGDADRRGQVADLPAARDDAAAGTCVVISPLIALMHDQLRAARANGIRAATLTSVDDDRDGDDRRVPRRRARPALRRARARQPGAFPRAARHRAAGAVRGRRGALRVRMGPRLPPRLSPAAPADGRVPARPAPRADRDRRRAHPRRHPRPARHSRRTG